MARSPVRLVVCINRRLGTGQRSCVGSGNLEYIAEVKRLIELAGFDVPVVERECLGKCEQGPVMRIAPGGQFYTEISQDSLVLAGQKLDACVAKVVSGLWLAALRLIRNSS